MWQAMMKAALLLPVAMLMAGCAVSAPPRATQAAEPTAGPLALAGEDTGITLDFNAHPTLAVAYDLGENELCYMALDNAVLVCAADVVLMFGAEDGVVACGTTPSPASAPLAATSPARNSCTRSARWP